MATKEWVGTTDGDWGVAGNWSPSGVPVAADDVFINSGSVSITAGLNQATIVLTSLRIGKGYTGSIGTASADLQIDATTFDFDGGGGGSFYLAVDATNATIKGGTGDDMLHLGKTSAANQDFDTCRVVGPDVQGKITLYASATINALVVQSAHSARIEIKTSATALTSITMDSGEIDCGANITTVDQNGGVLTMTDSATVTTLNLEAQSVCNYESDGTLTTANVYGGLLSFRSNNNDAITVTNAEVHPDGIIDARTGIRSITFTNGVIMRGGEFRPDIGQTITVA